MTESRFADVDVRATYRFLAHASRGVTELRVIAPDRRVLGIGYFDQEDLFVAACARANGSGNIYVGIQPRPQKFLAKATNRLRRLKSGARDHDIGWLTALVIDIDPVRPKGTSATDEELARAVACADRIADWLTGTGVVQPVRNMSGNGCQLWFAVPPLEITVERREEISARLRAFEAGIRARFATAEVAIDSIYNLSRIIKVIGTLSVKGENTAERPHRVSRCLDVFERREDAKLLDAIFTMPLESAAAEPGDELSPLAIAPAAEPGEELPPLAVAPALTPRLQALLSSRTRLRALFEGRGKTAIGPDGKQFDTSSSGYDFSLVLQLALVGVNEPSELAIALWHRPDGAARAKGERYIQHTVARAREVAASMRSRQHTDPHAPRDPPLPEIQVNGRQLRNVIMDARRVLVAANDRRIQAASSAGPEAQDMPLLFVRGRAIVSLERRPDTHVALTEINEAAMFGMLARDADWVQVSDDGTSAPAYPPKGVARDLITFPDTMIPRVDSVLTTPTFGRGGTLITAAGLHREESLWLELDRGLHVPDVPAAPAYEDVARARGFLLDELLVDFPFVSEADRAHGLAALLLPFMRRMILGCTPLHVIEAPAVGSGKSLLCHLISLVATGKGADGNTLPGNEEEVRKTITAELLKGCQIILLDNAKERATIDSSALASALTALTWRSRVLGRTEIIVLPNWALWMLTGNNPRLSTELSRRCVRIRIDSRQDQAWRRTGFKHDPVTYWALQHRGELVHAALVLVQAWIAAGMPLGAERLGSFEHWSAVMGGILEVAGVQGFLGNLDEMYASTDAEGEIWREFVAAWWEAFQDDSKRVSELNLLCEEQNLMGPLRGNGNARAQETRLGRALQTARDRMFGNLRLAVQRTKHRGRCYSLLRVGGHGEEHRHLPADDSDPRR